MARLEDLPLEILSMIFKYFTPFELETLARTFNRTLYIFAAPILGWTSSARRMTQIFEPCFPVIKSTYSPQLPAFRSHGLERRYVVELDGQGNIPRPFYRKALSTLQRSGPPDLHGLISLTGKLEWLVEPRPALTPPLRQLPMLPTYRTRPYTTPENPLPAIRAQADAAGFTLPLSLVNFLKDDSHKASFFYDFGIRFDIQPQMMRCPETLDGGIGGWLLGLYTERTNNILPCVYFSGRGSQHCVVDLAPINWIQTYRPDIRIPIKVNPDKIRRIPIKINPDEVKIRILALSLEEFLAIQYFEDQLEWIFFGHRYLLSSFRYIRDIRAFSHNPPKILEEYLRRVHPPQRKIDLTGIGRPGKGRICKRVFPGDTHLYSYLNEVAPGG